MLARLASINDVSELRINARTARNNATDSDELVDIAETKVSDFLNNREVGDVHFDPISSKIREEFV